MSDDATDPLAELRHRTTRRHAARGYGPLIVLAVLLVSVMLLAPSVARERNVVIEGPVDTVTTTVTTTSTTTVEAPG